MLYGFIKNEKKIWIEKKQSSCQNSCFICQKELKSKIKKTTFFNDSKVLIYMIRLYHNDTWYIYHRSSLSDTKEPSLYWWRLNVENLNTWTLSNIQELSDLTSVLKSRDNSVLFLHESKVWKQHCLFGSSSRLSSHVYC